MECELLLWHVRTRTDQLGRKGSAPAAHPRIRRPRRRLLSRRPGRQSAVAEREAPGAAEAFAYRLATGGPVSGASPQAGGAVGFPSEHRGRGTAGKAWTPGGWPVGPTLEELFEALGDPGGTDRFRRRRCVCPKRCRRTRVSRPPGASGRSGTSVRRSDGATISGMEDVGPDRTGGRRQRWAGPSGARLVTVPGANRRAPERLQSGRLRLARGRSWRADPSTPAAVPAPP